MQSHANHTSRALKQNITHILPITLFMMAFKKSSTQTCKDCTSTTCSRAQKICFKAWSRLQVFGTDGVPDKSYSRGPPKNIMNEINGDISFDQWSQIDFLSKICKFSNEILAGISFLGNSNSESYQMYCKIWFGQLNIIWQLDIFLMMHKCNNHLAGLCVN